LTKELADESTSSQDPQVTLMARACQTKPIKDDAVITDLVHRARKGEAARLLLLVSHAALIEDVVVNHGSGTYLACVYAATAALERTARTFPASARNRRLQQVALPAMYAAVANAGDNEPLRRESCFDRILLAAIGAEETEEDASEDTDESEEVGTEDVQREPKGRQHVTADIVAAALTEARTRFLPLNKNVESALIAALQDGARAFETLIVANTRLIVGSARRYTSRLPLWDRFSEGRIGLMKGALRFEPGRGFKISTYVNWWIRHAVTRANSDQARTVRIPVHAEDVMRKVMRHDNLSFDPISDDELAERSGVPLRKVRALRVLAQHPHSIDKPSRGDKGAESASTYGDLLPDPHPLPDEHLFQTLDHKDLLALLRTALTPRERDILEKRFWGEKTLSEIGAEYDLSRERVRQLEAQAFKKLRTAIQKRVR